MTKTTIYTTIDETDDTSSLPTYASKGAAGADVRAFISEPLILLPGKTCLVPTGLRCEIPADHEIQVRPRSGLALKHGVTVINSPGTIDSDYRGEIKIILINHGSKPFTIEPQMRIAQFVVTKVEQAYFKLVDNPTLSSTSRGEGGFGHSGTQ